MTFQKPSRVQSSTFAEVTPKLLETFTREELRNLARLIGVRRGQNKKDTIANLIDYKRLVARVTVDIGFVASVS